MSDQPKPATAVKEKAKNQEFVRRITSSDQLRALRKVNPFTGLPIEQARKKHATFSKEFHARFKALFCQRKTYSEMAEILDREFPEYSLTTDSVKSYYMYRAEEMLQARDESSGLFDSLKETEREALLHTAEENEMSLVDQLVHQRTRLVDQLAELPPEGKAYAATIKSLDILDKLIERKTGGDVKKFASIAKAGMLASVEKQRIMIKEGLVKDPLADTIKTQGRFTHSGENPNEPEDSGISRPRIVEAETVVDDASESTAITTTK